jgi:hypothetical protein
MPQTAHADAHQLRATAAAPRPRGVFGLRGHLWGTFPADTGFAARVLATAVSAPVCTVPLCIHFWKCPRTWPRGAVRMAEVP